MRIVCLAIFLSTLDAAPDAGLTQSFLSLPLSFSKRADSYVARGLDYSVALNTADTTLQIGKARVRMQLAGAKPCANLRALDPLPGKANYIFDGGIRRSEALYGRVSCDSPYAGIDLIFHGNQGQLEYDFVIAPGRRPDAIVLAFEGADELSLDERGDFVIRVAESRIRQPKPVAYQRIGNRTVPVSAEYSIDGSRQVHFRLGRYDRQRELVIDPVILFHTQFGGSGFSYATSIALDAQGNAYVAGVTNSSDFVTRNPEQNTIGNAPLLFSTDGGGTWTLPAFPAASAGPLAVAPSNPSVVYAVSGAGIMRSADGGRSWTAAAGSGLVGTPISIAVDTQDSARVYAGGTVGFVISTDSGDTWTVSSVLTAQVTMIAPHPAKPGTIFVGTQSPGGLYRSTNNGQTWNKLNLLPQGVSVPPPNVLLFNPVNPDHLILGSRVDPFETSSDGGDTWSIGGPRTVENPEAIAMDAGDPNTLYLANGLGVEKSIDGGGTWRTVLTLNRQFYPMLIAADPNHPGSAFAIGNQGFFRTVDKGETWTPVTLPYPISTANWITIAPGTSNLLIAATTNQDVFVTKWDPTGGRLLYSTFLGGSGSETPTAIAVDAAGNAYVAGYTNSANFPVTPGAFQTSLAGGQPGFVAKLSADGSKLLYSTLIGGGSEYIGGIAVDRNGDAYIAGSTLGNYPVTANAAQPSPRLGCGVKSFYVNYPTVGDAFVTKINSDGASLGYSTLLGGACGDSASGVALDANGNLWVAGTTSSDDFPVTAGALQPEYARGFSDGFLARYANDGSLSYATYLGGAGYDEFQALALDASGNIYLTGSSAGFAQSPSPGAFQPKASGGCLILSIGPPLFNPQGNAFVMKLDPAASNVLGLTYYGSPCTVSGQSIAIDSQGAPWIAGRAYSPTLPTASPFQVGGSGFLAKFSPDLTQLEFATYLTAAGGFALDPAGAAVFAGGEATTGAFSNLSPNQLSRAFVAKVDATPSAMGLDGIAPAAVSSLFPIPANPVIVPGNVIRLTGHGLGPTAATPGVITPAGLVATSVAGVTATFGGVEAPLLSVSSTEIECVVPFEVAGNASTTIQVNYNGAKSNAVLAPVNATGADVLAVLNEDFTVNSQANPAKSGSIITLYVTGLGQTNPPSVDGQVNRPPLPQLTVPLTVGFGNSPLEVTYAGAAQGLVAGIAQVNFRAPAQTTVNLNIMAGSGTSYSIAHFSVYVQ